jgi:hypothetical protein
MTTSTTAPAAGTPPAPGALGPARERQAIEARWPGWHVWFSDAGPHHMYATKVRGIADVAGVTLTAAGLGPIEEAIATWERETAGGLHPWAVTA